MKKILIVEDLKDKQQFFQNELSGLLQVLSAYTISDAETLYNEHYRDIVMIAMDACVPGDKITTDGLTKNLRDVFSGPMIAISSFHKYRKTLCDVGCDYECEKGDLPKLVRNLLRTLGSSVKPKQLRTFVSHSSSFLEHALTILHECLVPSDFTIAEEYFSSLEKAAGTGDMKKVVRARKVFDEMKNLFSRDTDPFNPDYVAKLTELRDVLLES